MSAETAVFVLTSRRSQRRPQQNHRHRDLHRSSRPHPAHKSPRKRHFRTGTSYSVYVDLIYDDGTPLWGQVAAFSAGTHDWEYREVMIRPEKRVKQMTVYGLFRGHSGTVWFDDFSIRQLDVPQGTVLFDGALVARPTQRAADVAIHNGTILVRDAAANSDFFNVGSVDDQPQQRHVDELKLELSWQRVRAGDRVNRVDVAVVDRSGKDRAISLYYAVSLDAQGWRWWDNVQQSRLIERDGVYGNFVRVDVGATGQQTRYPFACVSSKSRSLSLLMPEPRICRVAYDARQREFFVVCDFGLSRETKTRGRATTTFYTAETDPRWAMRATAQLYYKLLPQFFDQRRVPERQGNWMAFTKISSVERPEDFQFAVHEGNNDVLWDNKHGIQPFVYVEPMTFWMRMPAEDARTYEAALKRLESHQANPKSSRYEQAWAVKLSGLRSEDGRLQLSIRKAPWCDGAVFANSADLDVPEDGVHRNQGHLNLKRLRAAVERAEADGGLAGVYLDSLEGWGFLPDWCRDHWKAADLPLTFDRRTRKPVLLNIMATYEFTVAVSQWMHGSGKRLMANSVPHRFPWLANPLDLMGTETNWLRSKQFAAPSADDLYLKRTMAWHKPYMFLMNTHYDDFGPELVDRYMQRCLFYGMFPGFFSENASTNPYFGNSKWYNRDRSLFKKYLPVIKQVAEAGWEPITLATSSDPDVWIERFGVAPATGLFFTVMNTAGKPRHATIHCDELSESGIRLTEELDRTAQPVVPPWTLQLQSGEVRVFQAVAAESRRD